MSAKTLKIFMTQGTQPDGMSYPKMNISEIKEFKDADPKGYEELSKESERYVTSE